MPLDYHRRPLCVRLPAILAHRVAAHLDSMSVMNKPVKNTIGQSWIADLLMPTGDRKLRCQDGRADLAAVLTISQRRGAQVPKGGA